MPRNVSRAIILPKGPTVQTRDGRSWTYDPRQLVGAFAAYNGPLAVDYEHAQDLLAPNGQKAPAAGWIEEFEERDGAIWALIEWTTEAAAHIESGAYRYLSPATRHSGQTITRIVGASLVNRPEFYLPPLELSQTETDEAPVEAAKALAASASIYRAEQAELGRQVTVVEAIAVLAKQLSET